MRKLRNKDNRWQLLLSLAVAVMLAASIFIPGGVLKVQAEDDSGEDPYVNFNPEWSEGDGDDWHTWVFTGESQTIGLDTNVDENSITEIEWKLSNNNGAVTKKENDDNTVTLTGLTATGEDEAWPELRVCLTYTDEDGTERKIDNGIGFYVTDPTYDWDYPLSGGNQILPGWDRDISMGCDVRNSKYPNGEYVDVPLTNVEIVRTGEWDDDGNEVEDEKTRITIDDEDEDGVYTAYANNYDEDVSYGWVKLKYTWTNPWTQEKLTYGESEDEESTLYIVGDIYSIELNYRNDSNMMLPNDSMTVNASLLHEFIGDDGQDSEYIENFTLEIDKDTIDETDNEYFSAEVTEDGKSIAIETKENGDYGIHFQIRAKDEDGDEVADEWLDATISGEDGYYLIMPASLTTGEGDDVQNVNPNLGEELDLNNYSPQLMLYSSGNTEEVEVSGGNYRFRLTDYDENCWDVKEGKEDELIPALVRKGNWGTEITLVAEQKRLDEDGNVVTDENEEEIWDELTRRTYGFDGLNYDVDFVYSYGSRENSTLYSGADNALTLTLTQPEDTIEWPEYYELGWKVEKVTDDEGNTENLDENLVTVNYNKKNSLEVTLTANESAKLDFNVKVWAEITYNDKRIAETDTWVWVRHPTYDYDFPADEPGESDLLPGETYDIESTMNCYVENAKYPDGRDVTVNIDSLKIASQGDWDDDGDKTERDDLTVVDLDTKDEGGWLVTAKENGWAKLNLTYVSQEDDTEQTEEIWFYVSDEKYSLKFTEPASGTTMSKGESITVKAKLYHSWLDEDGDFQDEYKAVADWKLDVDEENSGDIDENLVVNKTGEGETYIIKITGKDYTEGNLCLKASVKNEEGTYDEVMSNYFWLCVSEDYSVIEADELKEDPWVGEELDLNGKVKTIHYYTEDDGLKSEKRDDVTYRLEYEEDEWSVKEGTAEDLIPVLIRKRAWDTNVTVIAEDKDGNEVARYEYRFDDNYRELGYTLSYGKLDDNDFGKVLTDIPLTVTLDTEKLGSLTGYSIEWYVYSCELNDGDVDVDEDTKNNVDSVTYSVSADGASLTLQGVEGKENERVWICAVVEYQDETVAYKAAGAVVTTCTHNWGSGTITTAPTATTKGVRTYTCSVCGATKTEDIATTGGQSSEGSTEKQQSSGNTTTGGSGTSGGSAASNTLKVGASYTDEKTGTVYTVTGANTMEYKKAPKKAKSVSIPKTVKANGVTYTVTSIAAKAFKNCKKLKKVVIPATIKKIGKQAFFGCKNLKKITIKTTSLTKKNVGAKAFKGINAKAKIKVPKKKLKAYKKMLKARGVGKKVKITK